ncbi:MAG: shikimate kinase [Gemmatales bacterium]|nr:MAG: shikimate kinase [Gemmatales bacterium]
MKSLLFLIGYRGTGKTTVARLLAERIGWNWVDADVLLEERAGRSIRTIFAEDGEDAFRTREAELLRELCKRERCVIATGGGVVLRSDNRSLLQDAGQVCWLQAQPVTIWQRLQEDPTTEERRPQLTIGGLAEIEQLLRQREPLYRECADFIIDTEGKSPPQIVDEICEVING